MLGRNRQSQSLYYFPAQPFSKEKYLIWQGTLTSYQQEISDGMKTAVANKENLLIHAVTGAGKTEMIYETVASVLEQGGQVCMASPRIDVCLELHKRLSRDFSCPIALLHGESEPYTRAPWLLQQPISCLNFTKPLIY